LGRVDPLGDDLVNPGAVLEDQAARVMVVSAPALIRGTPDLITRSGYHRQM